MTKWLKRWLRGSTVTHVQSSGQLSDDYIPPSGSLGATQPSGTYTITSGGKTTGAIPYNAPIEWPGDPANRSISNLEDRFRYHPPESDRRRLAHESVRGSMLGAADRFDVLLPNGREKSLAITKLEEAMFWANASLARTPDIEE